MLIWQSGAACVVSVVAVGTVRCLRKWRSPLGVATFGALLTAVPQAQLTAPRTPIEVSKLGPQVGEHVPDFSLKDQNGKTWTRQSIMGPKGAMLVFFRSADW